MLPDANQILVFSNDTGNVRTGSEKGAVFPSFTTTERDAIASPENGAGIYNSTIEEFEFYYKDRWNQLNHKTLLTASSFSDQEPSAVDTELQIEFGAAQGSGSDPVQLAVDGTVTINEDGFYWLTVGIQYGRDNTNLIAILHFRILLNGVQVGNSATAVLSTDTEDVPFSVTFGSTLEDGDEITLEIVRDSDGTNDGGLFSKTVSAAGWTNSPSSSIRVYR